MREQPQIKFTLITVFTTKLVQFVSYDVKPIIVLFIGSLINKLYSTYQYSQVSCSFSSGFENFWKAH